MLQHNVNGMRLKKPAKMNHAEFEASQECIDSKLYMDSNKKLILPARMLRGVLVNSAKKSGLRVPGKRSGFAEVVKSSIIFDNGEGRITNLTYDDIQKEYAFVRVANARVERIWPKLPEGWKAEYSITVTNPELLTSEILGELLQYGGQFIGVGDYRPTFGQFEVELKEVN